MRFRRNKGHSISRLGNVLVQAEMEKQRFKYCKNNPNTGLSGSAAQILHCWSEGG
jgi:hypothetical protein